MTLMRGNIGGYEFNRMVVLFSMIDGPKEIPCAVSAAAMDDLEHVSRTAPDEREQQFLRLRDRIEQCASLRTDRQFERCVALDDVCPHRLHATTRRSHALG
jgi:Protein of unknown function (DUF1488)